jgi:hypothetical protein
MVLIKINHKFLIIIKRHKQKKVTQTLIMNKKNKYRSKFNQSNTSKWIYNNIH